MNYRGLELKLRKIVEKRLEEGWSVVPTSLSNLGGYIVDDLATCCLIGAVGIESGEEKNFSCTEKAPALARTLGASVHAVLSVEDGFENGRGNMKLFLGNGKPSEKLRAIGARIRRDYCESK